MDAALFEGIKNSFPNDQKFCEAVLESLKFRTKYGAIGDGVKAGYVYIMSDGKHCKIGLTKNDPEKRLQALRVGNPEIFLIGAVFVDDCKRVETDLHKKFQTHKVSGEWFDIDPQVAEKELGYL